MGGILGGVSKNRKLRDQMRMLSEQQRENQNWYDRRYNEDATQRADAQRVLSMTEEAIRRRNKAAEGRAALMGGTDESVAAEKEANNRALADAASQIAASADRRKDVIEQQYLRRKDNLNEDIRGIEAEKLNGLDMLNNTVGGAVGGLSSGLKSDFYLSELKKRQKEEENGYEG